MVGIARILNHHNLGWWIAGPIVLAGDMSQQFWSIICVEYSAACYMHLYQYSQCTQDLVTGPQVSANLGHPWIHCKISEISSSYIFANNSLDNPCISDNRTVLYYAGWKWWWYKQFIFNCVIQIRHQDSCLNVFNVLPIKK